LLRWTDDECQFVIAGLDPAIHPLRKKDGCVGQARA
jgi:hypothetical protein